MENLKNDAIKRIKSMGYAFNEENDAWILSFIIDKCRNHILNIIHTKEVPEGLYQEFVDMAAGTFMYELKANNKLGADFNFEQAVESIKEGDTTVSFVGGESAEAKFDAYINSMMIPDASCLVRHRKMVW